MEHRTHCVRYIALFIAITVSISLGGIAGAFELTVTGTSHSMPLESGSTPNGSAQVPQRSLQPLSNATPVPTTTIPPYGGARDNSSAGRNDLLDQITSMLNRSVKPGNSLISFPLYKTPDAGLDTSPQSTGGNAGQTGAPPVLNQSVNTTLNLTVNSTFNATSTSNITQVPRPDQTPVAVVTPSGPAPSVSGHDLKGNGTICKIDMNGGFYGIVADDGELFVPDRIDSRFQVNGLRVSYRGLERPDKTGGNTWGVPVDLIELVQSGSVIEHVVSTNGTIRYIDVENGFYGIDGDNGYNYLPINLNATYETDGLRITFSAFPSDVQTIDMWGIPVRIITMAPTGELPDTTITMTGNITWVNGGGGFYGILGNDGILYIPSDLGKTFRKNELHVNFTAEKSRDNISTYQIWGVPVRLMKIEPYAG